MHKLKFKISLYLVITIILTLGFSISLQSLLAAWTPPTQAPPGGGTNPPIFNDSGTLATPTVDNKRLYLLTSGGGNAELDITSNGLNHWAIYHDAVTEQLRFWNNDVVGEKNALVIDNDGNVGIGEITPSAKLDIVGDIELSGSLNCTDCVDATDLAENSVGTSEITTNAVGASELLDILEGAQSKCENTKFLRGNGNCYTAAEITGSATCPCGGAACWDVTGIVVCESSDCGYTARNLCTPVGWVDTGGIYCSGGCP